jgi:hypothetical protein
VTDQYSVHPNLSKDAIIKILTKPIKGLIFEITDPQSKLIAHQITNLSLKRF